MTGNRAGARLRRDLRGERDATFRDRDPAGFGVRVYPSGCKVYVVRSRGPRGIARVTPGRHGELAAGRAKLHAAGFACHDGGMDADLIVFGLGLAALAIGLFAWVRAEISAGRREIREFALRSEICKEIRQEMRREIGALRDEIRRTAASGPPGTAGRSFTQRASRAMMKTWTRI